MAHAINTSANAPADAVRDDISRAERLVVSPTADNVEDFLLLLDRIEWRFDELEQNGVDLRPERGRRQGLHSRLSSKPEALVRATRRAGGLRKLRERYADHEQVDTTNFWWHLDATLSTRRYLSLRRTSLIFGSIILALVLTYWALDTFFPPSLETLLMLDVNGALDELILEENWDEALVVVEEARQQAPNEPELIVWSAVINERLGNDQVVQERLTQGLDVSTEAPAEFWNLVAQSRLRVGDLGGAEAAVDETLALDEDNAQAYFLLGNAAELRGEPALAVELFERTFALAQEENPQLAVISRVRVGTLLQQIGGNPFPTAEPLTDTVAATDTTTITSGE